MQLTQMRRHAGSGDLMANMLITKGDVYGKQFVIYESYQAYPMYVVTYTCPDDFTPRLMSPRTQVASVVEGYVSTEVSHVHNISILIPTTEAYEMGAQVSVRSNLDRILTGAQHEAL